MKKRIKAQGEGMVGYELVLREEQFFKSMIRDLGQFKHRNSRAMALLFLFCLTEWLKRIMIYSLWYTILPMCIHRRGFTNETDNPDSLL